MSFNMDEQHYCGQDSVDESGERLGDINWVHSGAPLGYDDGNVDPRIRDAAFAGGWAQNGAATITEDVGMTTTTLGAVLGPVGNANGMAAPFSVSHGDPEELCVQPNIGRVITVVDHLFPSGRQSQQQFQQQPSGTLIAPDSEQASLYPATFLTPPRSISTRSALLPPRYGRTTSFMALTPQSMSRFGENLENTLGYDEQSLPAPSLYSPNGSTPYFVSIGPNIGSESHDNHVYPMSINSEPPTMPSRWNASAHPWLHQPVSDVAMDEHGSHEEETAWSVGAEIPLNSIDGPRPLMQLSLRQVPVSPPTYSTPASSRDQPASPRPSLARSRRATALRDGEMAARTSYRASSSAKFRCNWPECKSNFSKKSARDQHSRIHQQRRHQCDQCNQRFQWLKDLDRHILKHTDERPFLCVVVDCDAHTRGFARRDNCRRHIRKAHGIRDQEPELRARVDETNS